MRYGTCLPSHLSPVSSVFADENQAVSAHQTTLEQIQRAGALPNPIILSANHRNTPEIARVAEHFHSGRLPVAQVQRMPSGNRPQLILSPDLAATCHRIANWYRNRGGTVGVIVRLNRTGSNVHSALASLLREHRVDLYVNNNEDSIDVRQPGITVLNVKSVKGQEFDALFVLELESFVPCSDEQARRVMYMLCARARDHLMLIYGPGALTSKATESLPPEHLLERS